MEFRHRALLAYGILSVGILAYGTLSILLLAYSILAMHLDWHSQIKITAWTFNCVFSLQFQSIHVYNIPIWPKKVQIFNLISTSRNLKKETDLQWVYYVAPTKLMTIEYQTDCHKCQRNYHNIQILHSCTVNFISDNSIKFISNKYKSCDQKNQ